MDSCGIIYRNVGQNEKAIEEFTRAIEIDPKYVNAFFNRGVTYGNIGQWKKAIDDYEIVLKINPNYLGASNNKEISEKKLKNMKK